MTEEPPHERVESVEALHLAVGGEPNYNKVLNHLETHSIRWARQAPFVGLNVATAGVPSIFLLDARHRVSPDLTSIDIRLDDGEVLDSVRSDTSKPVGTVWMLPALEEMMRVNGRVTRTTTGIRIHVEEMYLHCAKAVKRAKLWSGHRARDPIRDSRDGSEEAAFIRASPFALLATASNDGGADLSPRGDPSGYFCRLSEDGASILIPDRKGNKIADSMHNLLSNPRVAMVFLLPGSSRTLEVKGDVAISTRMSHRKSAAVAGKVPNIVLELKIESVRLASSASVDSSGLWRAETYATRELWPTFAKMVADQIYGEQSAAAESAADAFEEMTRNDYETNMY
jgi:uncharacterized protein